jgi:tRNA G18 (ribose-2'-O)-methylase SpoU
MAVPGAPSDGHDSAGGGGADGRGEGGGADGRDQARGGADGGVGVGPHPQPWPDDERLDPELLAEGDRRNVADRYRYWRTEAIVADLDRRRHSFHVAVENWSSDRNIGAVVRNANAFLAAEVHIVGRRRWNKRGAMVTDRYQHLRHHADLDELAAWARSQGLGLVGVDNIEGAVMLDAASLPRAGVLLFGQEGPGLSERARQLVDWVVAIRQYGSTRSVNAGVASGVVMHEWCRRHAG